MALVGVWERGGAVFAALTAAAGGKADFFCAAHPVELMGRDLALLVVAPDAQGWGGAGVLHCRTALVPGAAGPQAGRLKADSAVSYGAAAKNSITVSSLEGDKIVLAIQRELVTVSGAVVERQELVLPFPAGTDSDRFLCLAGALLLLDVPPGETPGGLA